MNRVLVLAGLILLAGGVMGCAGKTGMSFEELKQTLAAPRSGYVVCENVDDPAAGVVAIVKARLGQPYKEQVLGSECYLYYYVREGTAQIVVAGCSGVGAWGVRIEAINLL